LAAVLLVFLQHILSSSVAPMSFFSTSKGMFQSDCFFFFFPYHTPPFSFMGGNSTKATSGINGAGTQSQQDLGITDSAKIFFEDTKHSVSILETELLTMF
jgi:hypothetical protein